MSSDSSTRDPGHVTSPGGSEYAGQEPRGQHPQPLQCLGQAGRTPLPSVAAGGPTGLWVWDKRLVWGGEQGGGASVTPEELREPLRVFSRSTVAAPTPNCSGGCVLVCAGGGGREAEGARSPRELSLLQPSGSSRLVQVT